MAIYVCCVLGCSFCLLCVILFADFGFCVVRALAGARFLGVLVFFRFCVVFCYDSGF